MFVCGYPILDFQLLSIYGQQINKIININIAINVPTVSN